MNLLAVLALIILHGSTILCQDMTVDRIVAAIGWANRTVHERRRRPTLGGRTSAGTFTAAWTRLDHFNRANYPLRNRELSIGGEITIKATMMLKRTFPNWAASPAARTLSPLDVRVPVAGLSAATTNAFRKAAASSCMDSRPVVRCDPYQRYRETDGQCNNLYHRSYPSGAYKLGAAFTAQGRFLYPDYDDGVDSPRVSSVIPGSELPNARLVSRNIHSGFPFRSSRHTPYLTHFGQFIDHDIVSTPESKPDFTLPNSHCCIEPDLPECFNIRFSTDDLLEGSCMRFMRADTSPHYFCDLGPRLQQNQRSSFIDGTMIYGFDDEQEAKLRLHGTGYLRTGGDNQLKLEPIEDPMEPPCEPVRNQCFEAGDHRSLETVPLTVMHIMFMRRHNLIVNQLRKIPLPWTPELLYQEAKRIVIAELQHITYNEFLPRVLGPRVMFRFDLWPARNYYDSYSIAVDPRTTSGFSVAAYRFGHSLVRNVHNQIGPRLSPVSRLLLEDHFNRLDTHLKPFPGGNTEGFARWMAVSQKSRSDRTLVDGLQNKLFQCDNERCPKGGGVTKSFDLAALNVQRGRDHGLPSYTKWRKWCNGKTTLIFTPNAFGLSDHSNFEANILRNTYRHVDDIDLFSGAMTEMRRPGALVGPTFACIIGLQFSNYKRGDRFFYDRPDRVTAFTPRQLRAIKRTSLAKIICSTMKGFGGIQLKAMDVIGPRNPVVSCNRLRRDDILAKIPHLWNRLPRNALRSAAAKAAKAVKIQGKRRKSSLPAFSRSKDPSQIFDQFLSSQRHLYFRKRPYFAY